MVLIRKKPSAIASVEAGPEPLHNAEAPAVAHTLPTTADSGTHSHGALPATKAIRTHVGGPWEAFIEGQGQLPVIAIQFGGGHEWLIGKGWVK